MVGTNISFRDVYTSDERTEYIRAVKCLQAAESITPAGLGSGIRTRFDDFVATHMNQTTTIHLTGNFLSWHRYFIWLYEQALQEECGYEGSLPVCYTPSLDSPPGRLIPQLFPFQLQLFKSIEIP